MASWPAAARAKSSPTEILKRTPRFSEQTSVTTGGDPALATDDSSKRGNYGAARARSRRTKQKRLHRDTSDPGVVRFERELLPAWTLARA